jgi:hypothetical protein
MYLYLPLLNAFACVLIIFIGKYHSVEYIMYRLLKFQVKFVVAMVYVELYSIDYSIALSPDSSMRVAALYVPIS